MIKSYDGTSYRRVGGQLGDRLPAVGFQRLRATYTATGGETSINLSSLTPQISYIPGQAQIAIKRSSGGALIAGLDFTETSATTVAFPSTEALIAGEIVEITREFGVTGVMAAQIRPDIYTVTASAAQTTVTADFSWPYNMNSTKAQGAVRVYLNGILQSRGIDYTESNLTTANTNAIVFVDALVGGENITLIPSYQVIDQSAATATFVSQQISNTQAAFAAGAQGFVDQSATIAVPNTTIVNRAKIPNLASDLRPSFGPERIMTNNGYSLQSEFGPAGEPVIAIPNDTNGLIRFVGTWTAFNATAYGQHTYAGSVGDFIEVTFYGTALNILTETGNTQNTTYQVDGGGAVTFNFTAASNVLGARNYNVNAAMNVVTGLSLGLHTVKITSTNGQLRVYGFEIVNANSTTSMNVNPGTAYIGGQLYTLASAATSTFGSAFTNISGTAGARGGRVLAYLASDGTIKKDIQYVNTAQANMASADHTNEEVSRTYSFREFGAGRTDDFSLYSSSTATSLTFTLDDGTTTLTGSNVASEVFGGVDSLTLRNATSYIAFTFVGTGLDIFAHSNSGITADTNTILVDGVSVSSTFVPTTATPKQFKIVSGLPYGTHTVRITRNAAIVATPCLYKFVTYQPKTPTLPTSAVALGSYNLMATYVAGSSGITNIGTGVLRKQGTREFVYSGTWAATGIDATNFASGYNFNTGTATSYYQYTFFGTGFDLSTLVPTLALNSTISVDGSSNLSGFTTGLVQPGTGVTFTASTGVIAGTPSVQGNIKVQVSGLTLGIHVIRVTCNSSTTMYVDSIDVITPIHSPKSNIYGDIQNTLPVGSCALSDDRKTSMIKEALSAQKFRAVAIGVQTPITTTSLIAVPMADMSLTVRSSGSWFNIDFSVYLQNTTTSSNNNATIYLNGLPLTSPGASQTGTANLGHTVSGFQTVYLPAGVHKVDLYWLVDGGTCTSAITSPIQRNRILRVIEL